MENLKIGDNITYKCPIWQAGSRGCGRTWKVFFEKVGERVESGTIVRLSPQFVTLKVGDGGVRKKKLKSITILRGI